MTATRQVRFATNGTKVFVLADGDGDGSADLDILLTGVTSITADDFTLKDKMPDQLEVAHISQRHLKCIRLFTEVIPSNDRGQRTELKATNVQSALSA